MRAADSFAARFSAVALKEVFLSEICVKPTVGIDKVTVANFEEHLDDNLDVISRKVLSGTYRFTNYRQKLIAKGKDDCPREINIPTLRDKLALRALVKVLDDVYGDSCMTPQPQPIVAALAASRYASEFTIYIKADITKFYKSIDHKALMRIIRRKIRKKELLALIENAISTPSVIMGEKSRARRSCGVPEGLPVSNRLANLYAEDIDKRFDRAGISYFRYVDDIMLLCDANDKDSILGELDAITKRLHLERNGEKCSIGNLETDSFEYLGYRFEAGLIRPRKGSIRNLERWLESHMRSYKDDYLWKWRLNVRIAGCRTTEDGKTFKKIGWLFYFSQSDDVACVCKLDALVRKLANRYNVPLPSDLKSFKKSYYEIRFRSGDSHYIPLIDYSESEEKKKATLSELYGEDFVNQLSDESIDRIFRRKIGQELKYMERDVGLSY